MSNLDIDNAIVIGPPFAIAIVGDIGPDMASTSFSLFLIPQMGHSAF